MVSAVVNNVARKFFLIAAGRLFKWRRKSELFFPRFADFFLQCRKSKRKLPTVPGKGLFRLSVFFEYRHQETAREWLMMASAAGLACHPPRGFPMAPGGLCRWIFPLGLLPGACSLMVINWNFVCSLVSTAPCSIPWLPLCVVWRRKENLTFFRRPTFTMSTPTYTVINTGQLIGGR